MSDDTPGALASLSPPDPALPTKTWRGTLAIVIALGVLAAVVGFLLYRWSELQSFSPELRFEGYHRFSGTLLPPEPVAGSPLIKLRLRTDDGHVLVLPPIEDNAEGAPPIASYPTGTCVEGTVRNHRAFLAEMSLTIEGRQYRLDGDAGWVVTDPAAP